MPEVKETLADKAKREAAEAAQKAELKKQADEEEARILASDEGSNKDLPDTNERAPGTYRPNLPDTGGNTPSWHGNFKSAEQDEAAKTAAEHLYSIVCEFPQSTPDTHTVFGFGGKLFKLGDLRALFGMRRA